MSEVVSIARQDPESPRYSRTVVRVGDDSYLVAGIDRARGLLLLEMLAREPERQEPVAMTWDGGREQ